MPTDGLHIRNAEPEDAVSIASVQIDAWRTTYAGIIDESYLAGMSLDENKGRWDRILALGIDDPKRVSLVATVDERVIAFASGGPARGDNPPTDGELFALYMLAGYQGRGYGKRLFDTFVRSMARIGFRSLMVWVLKENRSGGFYRAMHGIEASATTITIGDGDHVEISYLWPSIAPPDASDTTDALH
jgi:GNAT superfamily N-acetyltransferase